MSDPIDNSRDESRRADRRKEAQHHHRRTQNVQTDFAAKVQAHAQAKEKGKSQLDEKKEFEKENPSKKGDPGLKGELFGRLREVFKNKGDKGEKGDDGKKEIVEKIEVQKGDKEDKTDQKEEKSYLRREVKTEGRSEEGHRRVEARSGRDDGGTGGGGSGGGGSGGGSPGGGQGGSSFGSSQKSFSDSGSGGGKHAGEFAAGRSGPIQKLAHSSDQGESDSNRSFSEEVLNEIVEKVHLCVNAEGNPEMEIELGKGVFSGLKFKATRTAEGIALVFYCPNREVRNLFILNRPRFYSRFREKNIKVTHIEMR